jgi:hypothetical protein
MSKKDKPIIKQENVIRAWSKGMQLTKSQKRVAATILDSHERGAFKRMCLQANQEFEDSKKKKVREEKD